MLSQKIDKLKKEDGIILIFGDAGAGKTKLIKEIVGCKKVVGAWGSPREYKDLTDNFSTDGDDLSLLFENAIKTGEKGYFIIDVANIYREGTLDKLDSFGNFSRMYGIILIVALRTTFLHPDYEHPPKQAPYLLNLLRISKYIIFFKSNQIKEALGFNFENQFKEALDYNFNLDSVKTLQTGEFILFEQDKYRNIQKVLEKTEVGAGDEKKKNKLMEIWEILKR